MARKPTVSPDRSLAARHAALMGRPHRLPPVRTEEKDGKLYVTVQFKRPAWQRILGADAMAERTFGLDKYGRIVYALCDGERTVRTVIAQFAEATRISLPEAEMNVTRFMRTLLSKGLVAMAMDREGVKGDATPSRTTEPNTPKQDRHG